jgi:hypothetical protein
MGIFMDELLNSDGAPVLEIEAIYRFANGNVMVFDGTGKQVPLLQGLLSGRLTEQTFVHLQAVWPSTCSGEGFRTGRKAEGGLGTSTGSRHEWQSLQT